MSRIDQHGRGLCQMCQRSGSLVVIAWRKLTIPRKKWLISVLAPHVLKGADMNRTVECLFGSVALLALISGCSGSSSSSGDGVTSEAKSSLSRDMSPNVPAADETALVSGNNAFAIDMYKAIRHGEHEQSILLAVLDLERARDDVRRRERHDRQ